MLTNLIVICYILKSVSRLVNMIFVLSDRHDEFLKLERSIREVHDLFVELGALVMQQGD